jgi:diaminopimelate dehydrogenase
LDNTKMRVAVVGYGNLGHCAVDSVREAKDMELAGIVRRNPVRPEGLDQSIPVVGDVSELGRVDVALLCVPSLSIPQTGEYYLSKGINTVDTYDVHGELVQLKSKLDPIGKKSNAVAIISAGWDPGTNSMIRAMFEVMAPKGLTYTNYGPGMSMGHSVVVKNIPGVVDAISLTVPAGEGKHHRKVYVQLEPGANFDEIKQKVLSHSYFVNDPTDVTAVSCVQDLIDMGHGVRIERKGVSGRTHNQMFTYDIRINNPALTAQIMVGAARAGKFQPPGAYTLLEVPLINLLPGKREDLLRRLV